MVQGVKETKDGQVLVSIAMCTYKRPQMVETLDSIIAMTIPQNVTLEIVVVDNDPEQSGRAQIERFSRLAKDIPVIYFSEPRKNISHARNACLDHSSGDWICFIDDDEIADSNYLENLLGAANEHGADVVNGRVVPKFSSDAPKWIVEGGFFQRKRYVTGKVIDSCGAGTTLVRVSAIKGFYFDEKYGASGGEDSEFFHRIHLNGGKLIYCDEAFVEEGVEQKRLNLRYLLLRRFRIGMTYSRYRYANSSLFRKIIYFAKISSSVLIFSGISVFSIVLPRRTSYKVLVQTSDKIGKIAGLFWTRMPSMY